MLRSPLWFSHILRASVVLDYFFSTHLTMNSSITDLWSLKLNSICQYARQSTKINKGLLFVAYLWSAKNARISLHFISNGLSSLEYYKLCRCNLLLDIIALVIYIRYHWLLLSTIVCDFNYGFRLTVYELINATQKHFFWFLFIHHSVFSFPPLRGVKV